MSSHGVEQNATMRNMAKMKQEKGGNDSNHSSKHRRTRAKQQEPEGASPAIHPNRKMMGMIRQDATKNVKQKPPKPPPPQSSNATEEKTADDKKSSKQKKGEAAIPAMPEYDPLEFIPEEYRKHGVDTEPMLYYIKEKSDEEELDRLLEAAQRDVRLHQARIRAATHNNVSLLAEYDFLKDPIYTSRQERKTERISVVAALSREAKKILKELDEDKKNLTPEERVQVKLARWQRALELYVYCPSEMSLDLLGLLEKLLDGTSEVSTERE